LLHSRPIDASEYLPALWTHGIRGFHLVFNVPSEPVAQITRAYRDALDALADAREPALAASRALLDGVFTRGHFARAV
jgi:putative protease